MSIAPCPDTNTHKAARRLTSNSMQTTHSQWCSSGGGTDGISGRADSSPNSGAEGPASSAGFNSSASRGKESRKNMDHPVGLGEDGEDPQGCSHHGCWFLTGCMSQAKLTLFCWTQIWVPSSVPHNNARRSLGILFLLQLGSHAKKNCWVVSSPMS